MPRFKTSTPSEINEINTADLPEHAHFDIENTNASIFRDALSEPVIRCLVAGGSEDAENSAREKRLRKKKKKNGKNEKKGAAEEDEKEEIDDEDTDEQKKRHEMDDLGDFIDYLSSEIFTALPDDLRTLTYAAVQDDERLASKYAVPVPASTVEDIATRHIPASIADSLLTYDLFFLQPGTTKTNFKINDNNYKDLTSFLGPILTSYINSITSLSPHQHPSSGGSAGTTSWRATRAHTRACELCSRDWVPLTYHHLIPRSSHARVLKRGWHRPDMLNVVAWLCRPCHDTVHRVVPSNEELAKHWYTVDLLAQRDDVSRFVGWVGRVRGLAR